MARRVVAAVRSARCYIGDFADGRAIETAAAEYVRCGCQVGVSFSCSAEGLADARDLIAITTWAE